MTIIMRDVAIEFTNILSDRMGSYNENLLIHLLIFPIDAFVMFVISAAGHLSLQDRHQQLEYCLSDEECEKYANAFQMTMLFGICYVLLNCILKIGIVILFTRCFSNEDERPQRADTMDAVLRNLTTGTYETIITDEDEEKG